MKFLIVFISSVLMCASAAPSALLHHQPLVYTAAVVPAASQWHAQSGLGTYSYGYQGGPSAKSEIKTLDGITQGSYSYIDANSQLQTVNYVSDALGFRVAATNLPTPPVDDGKAPEPVEDTVEVKAAREEHLAAVEKAQNGEVTEVQEVAPLKSPEPVEDTVEVKAARAEHLKAVEAAKTRSSDDESETETIVQPPTVAIHGVPVQAIQTVQSYQPLVYHAAPVAAPIVQYAASPVILKSQPAFSYSVWEHPAGIPQLIAA